MFGRIILRSLSIIPSKGKKKKVASWKIEFLPLRDRGIRGRETKLWEACSFIPFFNLINLLLIVLKILIKEWELEPIVEFIWALQHIRATSRLEVNPWVACMFRLTAAGALKRVSFVLWGVDQIWRGVRLQRDIGSS